MSGKNANIGVQSLPIESQFLLYQTEDGLRALRLAFTG